MQEIWKPVVGYEGIYEVSNNGNIASLKFGKRKILKHKKDFWWYFSVSLHKDWKPKFCLVHRVVAIAFLNNLNNKPQVNHIDWDKKNNNLENLEWATARDNQKHAYAIWIKKITEKNNFKICSRQTLQYSKDWKFIASFSSLKEAERITWIDLSNICSVCRWRIKLAWWFKWEYWTNKKI